MSIIIVVDKPTDWPLNLPGGAVVSARAYLTDPDYSELRGAKIFNLCRSYRYQSSGYYVSLLAEARGHRPLPNISTIQDIKSQSLIRFVSDDLDEVIQKSLAPIHSEKFVLSIYFGQNLAKRHDRLALRLFNLFPAPLLRAHFVRNNGKWQLQNIQPIAASEIPEEHQAFVVEVAAEYFAGRGASVRKRAVPRYDLAILHNPQERHPPSNAKALQRFIKAAEALGFSTELITKDDYGRIAEFDALFIRETTSVNHHTYRFARRAIAEGLVVVDDPESILKCSNKVYLAELLDHHKLATPKTLIVHKDNVRDIVPQLGLPTVLKQPDSSFSQGVVKAETEEELRRAAAALLDKSDLVIAQEFVQTPFDWRVGIIDGYPLYVCKYYMARKHWQIIKPGGTGKSLSGRHETLPVEFAPRKVVSTAVRAAKLIGNGFYGVDIKEWRGTHYVIEVNDNPSIDAGVEDAVLKGELYDRIMAVFLKRIQTRSAGSMKA
jgi:glutathione synthase/RimK-type ligase-like ATP-grasp enzyme